MVKKQSTPSALQPCFGLSLSKRWYYNHARHGIAFSNLPGITGGLRNIIILNIGVEASMTSNSPDLSSENAKKSLALASALFPGEEWVLKEPGIWVAISHLSEEYKEPDKWEREMS
jgi:hypothetical protein